MLPAYLIKIVRVGEISTTFMIARNRSPSVNVNRCRILRSKFISEAGKRSKAYSKPSETSKMETFVIQECYPITAIGKGISMSETIAPSGFFLLQN